MARRRPGDEPLYEPMMVSLLRMYASLGLNELNDWVIFSKRNLIF